LFAPMGLYWVYHFISYTHNKHILQKIIRVDSFHLLTDLFELIAVMSANLIT
jgi:hypothetical protein